MTTTIESDGAPEERPVRGLELNLVERPPTFADAKERRVVRMVDGRLGVLTRLPGRTPPGAPRPKRPNRASVIVAGGRYAHPTVDEIVAVDSPTTIEEPPQPKEQTT